MEVVVFAKRGDAILGCDLAIDARATNSILPPHGGWWTAKIWAAVCINLHESCAKPETEWGTVRPHRRSNSLR